MASPDQSNARYGMGDNDDDVDLHPSRDLEEDFSLDPDCVVITSTCVLCISNLHASKMRYSVLTYRMVLPGR
eukprot:154443-Rhodomonas_salina.2